jgi:hypothetical protein
MTPSATSWLPIPLQLSLHLPPLRRLLRRRLPRRPRQWQETQRQLRPHQQQQSRDMTRKAIRSWL